MQTTTPSFSRILVMVVFALSCFGFTLFVWRSFGGPTPFEAKGYRIHVLSGSEASQLSPNADVRISGVNVGKVVAVKRATEGADATIQLKPRFAPLPKDAKAIVRFKTLLGETFDIGREDLALLLARAEVHAASRIGRAQIAAAGRKVRGKKVEREVVVS